MMKGHVEAFGCHVYWFWTSSKQGRAAWAPHVGWSRNGHS